MKYHTNINIKGVLNESERDSKKNIPTIVDQNFKLKYFVSSRSKQKISAHKYNSISLKRNERYK